MRRSSSDPTHGEIYEPPVGHVIGHRLGGPPPPPRDPSRPAGRIGPYTDVIVHTADRPVGRVIETEPVTARR